jgi:hypothetical protein
MKKDTKLTTFPAGSGKIDLPASAEARGLDPHHRYTVAIKVARPGYVPEGITVRAQAGESVFTAEVTGETLKRLEADPLVVSVSISRRLPLID